MTTSLELRGVQEPRLWVRPSEVAGSFGPEAVAFAAGYGMVADDWQGLALEDWLAFRADMKWSSSRCGLSVPRQNGKNGVIEIRELFGMVGLGERILHTAHEVKTARKAFKRLKHFFGEQVRDPNAAFPELNAMVVELRSTNGQEAIVLDNGGSIEFAARSRGSARGFTVDVVVMDEAQELGDEAFEALGPTTRSAPLKNRQFIWAGTPPGEGNDSAVFTRTRLSALEGDAVRTCWHEWSCPEGVDFDDPMAWAQSNPALGGRLELETIQEDRASFSDDGFGRECLGIWNAGSSNAPIDPKSWAAVADTESQIAGRPVAAIDVAPDNRTGAVAVAGRRADGLTHIELVENRAGAGWIVDFMKAMHRKNPLRVIRVQGGNAPSAPLIEPLEAAGLPVKVTGPNDAGAACAALYSSVMDRSLRHLDQPVVNSSLADARKRALGTEGLWVWNRKNTSVDITPVIALTLAAAAVDAAPPARKHAVSNTMYGFN